MDPLACLSSSSRCIIKSPDLTSAYSANARNKDSDVAGIKFAISFSLLSLIVAKVLSTADLLKIFFTALHQIKNRGKICTTL